MGPTFFATPADWRAWLEAHHASAAELSVGFWKVGSGKPSITWPESVDEALCFGWIDRVRNRIDDEAYRIRFTPRRPASVWSQVNLKRFAELNAAGRVAPPGQAAFAARKLSAYTYERPPAELSAAETAALKANPEAWAAIAAAPPGYRRLVLGWVTQAKRPETRARRLQQLIDVSAAGRRIDFMKPASQR